MKKQDLIVGKHGVETRSGKRYVVAHCSHNQGNFLLGSGSYMELNEHSDNMTHPEYHNLDIVKVFNLTLGTLDCHNRADSLIWEETTEQACASQIADVDDKISRHEYKIKELKEQKAAIQERLPK